ncbi:alpha-L-arabinofuranosidase A [Coniella lustricola]|uniref:non-reducing end alpha-L-arabinofuranosidase n=1 Tax=Coniella lustricola TaxID=2025994 RepID=A0A2T3ABY4_9PEZI|nr:alpha-L-arabinofuranosidase A [Coniella lustricola]
MAPRSLLSATALVARGVAAVTLSVASSGGNATSGLQYGLMFEDINHSGDGGIYAELVQNRAFQGSTTYPSTIDPWTAVGGAALALDNTSVPLSSALPTSLAVTASADGIAGISNPGWWGIDVLASSTYSGSFWVLGDYAGNFTARLVSDTANTTLASATIAGPAVADSWTQFTYELQPSADAPSINNSLVVTFDATSGETLNFNLISLFPPTYKDTPNGNRVDLMEALAALNTKHFRIPGGNNLEGEAPPYWWNWTTTVGPLVDRESYVGTWDYENTNGLGLVEYILWCQDLAVEPVLAVWAGEYLDETIISEADLGVYVQSALDELEFLMGDASTTWGAYRIALGYEDAFSIKYVEVGNEDNLNGGDASYVDYRFAAFYDAIHAAYPDILIFESLSDLSWTYESAGQDYHQYTLPNYFVGQFNFFDNLPAGNPIQVGEFAVVQNNTANVDTGVNWADPKNPWPYWIGSVSEAIFVIGMERNADRVWGWSYAPLLQNLNSYEWSPDLISFTADQSQTVTSTSYDVLKLFGNAAFTSTLPADTSDDFGPAYWVAGEDNATSTYYVKAAVYNSTEDVGFNVSFDGVASGATASLTVLTAPDGYSYNSIGSTAVVTTTSSLTADDSGAFSFSLPNLSVALLSASA